jgi:hypothetical protein
MSKIRLTRPQSTPGEALYGSLRRHSTFVSITIETGNAGDHLHSLGDTGDDTGFKSAHDSRLMRQEGVYKTRPGHEKPEFCGYRTVEAEELSDGDRHEEVVEIHMSHEQFAELLTSTGCAVDCTIAHLRGVGKPGAVYVEDVKTPPDIGDRMKRRIEKTHEKALAEIDRQTAAIDGWKATEKIKAEARESLRMVRQHLASNVPFAVAQAVEEVSVHVEAATTIIADKVAALEASGHLPAGSTDRFMSGGGLLALPMVEKPTTDENVRKINESAPEGKACSAAGVVLAALHAEGKR